MPQFHTKHLVAHSAEEMFRLVSDVERYPDFVPLCTGLTVTSRSESNGIEQLVAAMSVGHESLSETFTTSVFLDPAGHEITVSYLDGPFSYLENRWQFIARSAQSCEVDFFIAYELRSALLRIALGPVVDRAFQKFTKAFEDRADEIYSTRELPGVSS